MLEKEVKTGMQVQISFRGRAGESRGPYTTRVEVVEDENTVLIHTPMEKGARVRLVERNVYKLNFLSGSSQIHFDARFLEETRVERFHMLRFEVVSPGEKVQRRNAYRLACSMPVRFNIVHADGEQSEDIEGVIHDLSAGGIKMVSKENIAENALLRIDLHMGKEYVMAFGLVKMKRRVPENATYPYTYGISFEAMPEKDSERIVRHVYNEQRKLLKKPQRSLFNYNH